MEPLKNKALENCHLQTKTHRQLILFLSSTRLLLRDLNPARTMTLTGSKTMIHFFTGKTSIALIMGLAKAPAGSQRSKIPLKLQKQTLIKSQMNSVKQIFRKETQKKASYIKMINPNPLTISHPCKRRFF